MEKDKAKELINFIVNNNETIIKLADLLKPKANKRKSDKEDDEEREEQTDNNKMKKNPFNAKREKKTIKLKKDNNKNTESSEEENIIKKICDLDIDEEEEDIIPKNKNTNLENKKKQTQSEENEKEPENDKEENKESITFLYTSEDEEGNKKLYSIKKHIKNNKEIYLTCKDRKCAGSAKYDKETDELKIIKKCNILYNNHNYVKEKVVFEKIRKNNINEEEMEDAIYQKGYFKYMNSIHPSLNYDDIVLELIERYNVKKIKFSKKQFMNYKYQKKEVVNEEFFIDQKIKNIKLYDIPLQKYYINYYDIESKQYEGFRIFGTEESLNLLSSKNITQYFIDSTYKCLPANQKAIKAFVLLIGYNLERDMFELCCAAVFSKEDSNIYTQFYETLKNNYSFNPKRISLDFALANLKAVNDVFGQTNIEIIPCLFHLLQAWWRKAIKLGLKKKIYIKNTETILFNIELIPFMDYSHAIKFYKKIREKYNDNSEYDEFFEYIEKNWLSLRGKDKSVYKFSLWSYFEKYDLEGNNKRLISDSVLEDKVFFSNNCCESLNHLINSYIAVNNKVSFPRFEEILKNLFIRMECGHSRLLQLNERINIKRKMSDVIIDLIKSKVGINLKIITFEEMKKLKSKPDLDEIFKIVN